MNYKNIRSLLLVWIAAGVVSCHGDLDIMQDNKLSVSNMWKTSIQVENSTYGIYSAMRDNFVQDQVNVLTWGELRVGEYMWRNSRTETIWLADLRSVVQNTMSSTTNAVSWSKLYTAIDQANAVLKYAPAVAKYLSVPRLPAFSTARSMSVPIWAYTEALGARIG